MVLRSVGVLSVGKIMGVMYAIMGLFLGFIMALVGMAGVVIPNQGNGPNPFAAMAGLGLAAIIVVPIMYGILGVLVGIISAAIYNVLAGMVGGIELHFDRPAGQ